MNRNGCCHQLLSECAVKSVRSQRLFSATGHLIMMLRSRLLPQTAKLLEFLNKNISPIRPRRRPIVWQCPTGRPGNSPARSILAPLPAVPATSRARHWPQCQPIVQTGLWGSASGTGQRYPGPRHTPTSDPTLISMYVKRYVLGRNRVSIETREYCNSQPGNTISRELTSLDTRHAILCSKQNDDVKLKIT